MKSEKGCGVSRLYLEDQDFHLEKQNAKIKYKDVNFIQERGGGREGRNLFSVCTQCLVLECSYMDLNDSPAVKSW